MDTYDNTQDQSPLWRFMVELTAHNGCLDDSRWFGNLDEFPVQYMAKLAIEMYKLREGKISHIVDFWDRCSTYSVTEMA